MTLQSTVASIQNIRKQRQLELELGELDKKWHVELKVIARERLSLVKELCRINQDLKDVDHFKDSVRGKALTRFADKAQRRLLQEKEVKEIHKFNFQPDPVEKMNMQLPLIREEMGAGEEGGGGGGGGGGDIRKVVTAKDLTKQRVQLQKTNFEQCTADRRSRRRPFWDKAVIEARKRETSRDRPPFFRPQRPAMMSHTLILAPPPPPPPEHDEESMKRPALSNSPSLPTLNRLVSEEHFRADVVHPSLSKQHSASMDYLPVIRTSPGTHIHHPHHTTGIKTFKPAPVSSAGLPTILET